MASTARLREVLDAYNLAVVPACTGDSAFDLGAMAELVGTWRG